MHPLHSSNLKGDTYRTGRWVCIDFETTNKEYGNPMLPENRVVMAAWQEGVGDDCAGAVEYHYGTLAGAAGLWDAIERADFVVAQNGKFEAHWLWNAGYDPTGKLWYDTMLGEWVLLGNNTRKQLLDLDSLAKRYNEARKDSIINDLMEGGVCPSEMPERGLIARCRRDVRSTARIARKQLHQLAKQRLLGCAVVRCLTMPVLCAIERGGLTLDAERVRATHAEYLAEYDRISREFEKFSGGVNFNSAAQMAHFLYGGGLLEHTTKEQVGTYKNGNPKFKKVTEWVPNPGKTLRFPEPKNAGGKPKRNQPTKAYPAGAPKTDKGTMEWLREVARTKQQLKFFEITERLGTVTAALSKNLDFFKGVVDERDGRFYAEIRQCTTATHRLSGRGRPQQFKQFTGAKSMQTQNSPRAFKKLYRAHSPDYWATDADAAQLEFRVAAFIGQDAIAMQNIRDPDFDAHIQTASVMHDPEYAGDINEQLYAELLAIYRDELHPRYKEVKGWRQNAKADTYKPLYGGERGTPTQERYYQWFQQRYCDFYAEGMRALGCVEAGDGTGSFRTPTGLTFTWDFYFRQDMAIDKYKHKPIKPAVFNYPVQYLATGEIVPIALVHLYYRVQRAGLRVRFTNTVHDSVSADVHKEDLDSYRELVVQSFTYDVFRFLKKVYDIDFNVPLGCELTWGEHLGEGESFAIDIDPIQEAASGK